MRATPLLIASLAASIAGPSLAQNAQYPPWPSPQGQYSYDPPQPAYDPSQSSYDPYGPPPEPPPPPPQQPYDSRYDDQAQAAPYEAQPGPPEPPAQADYAPYDDQPRGAPNAAQLGAPPSTQLVTPSQEGSKSITTAAEAPLHQLNLISQRIPPVLMAALADPYASPNPLTCVTLASAIADLTVALGPDYDYVPPEPQRGKKLTESGGMGLQLANGAAGSILPYGGLIGALTGANKRDAKIMRALAAGGARRAYLKGLGEARSCPEPAAPRHLAWAAPPVYDGPRRPEYPIR